MSKYQEKLENEFFIIDTSNLDTIKQRLYGFALSDNEIIDNRSIKENVSLDAEGTYVFVEVNEDEINITQDFNGCYGLYIFKTDDYFAISNSFVKLVDYLKYNHKLTLNKDYADAFLFARLVSFAYKDTLVNEIKSIPRNNIITINKKNKTLKFTEIDYQENTIPIDSKEGIELLDAWYYKWVYNIRNLKKKTNNIIVDLTGGFDSRIIACIWLTANIDLNKIRINSNTIHKEDYEIASKIAEFFNFKLKRNIQDNRSYKFEKLESSLKLAFYIELGFHKKPFFIREVFLKPIYNFNGYGGGTVRGYPNRLPNKYLKGIQRYVKIMDSKLCEPSKRILLKGYDEISKKFNIDKNSNKITEIHHKEVRNRLHFGKHSVSKYLENRYSLSPLNDPLLRKLKLKTANNKDTSIIFAIIYSRYCPELLKFEFDNGREIDQDTIDYVSKLNKKHPFIKKELNYISGPEIKTYKTEDKAKLISQKDVENFLIDVFLSNSFEMEFKKYFSSFAYNIITEKVLNPDYSSLKRENITYTTALDDIIAAISIVKIGNDCRFSQLNKKDIYEWFNQFKTQKKSEIDNYDLNKEDLIKYNNGIIYMKNINKGNDLEFIDENNSINITSPKKLQNKSGKTYIINSFSNHIDLKIKCINDGKLIIKLKGPCILDKLANKFPVYIDYTNFEINGEKIINKNTLVSFDDNFTYTKKVKDGEIINFKISWLPFNRNSVYKNNKSLNYNKIKRKIKIVLKRFLK